MSVPYNQQLIDRLVKAWELEKGETPWTKYDLVIWAIQKKLWDPPLKSKIQLLSEELGDALGTARKIVDGRKVRQYHCIEQDLGDGKQMMLWCHIDLATPEFLERSVARRRRSLRNQNIQLHNDVVHINETKGTSIQLLLDYTDDIADYEHNLKEQQDLSDQEDLTNP